MRVYKVAALYYTSCVWTHMEYFCLLGREGKKRKGEEDTKGEEGQKGGGKGWGKGGGLEAGFPPPPFWVTCLYRFYLLVPKHLTIY